MPAAAPTPARGQHDFERLYAAELDYVWNSVRRLGVAPAHLEDVTQEVFVTAWKRMDTYDSARPLRPWLFGIAFRVASDFKARAWQRHEVSDDEADGTDTSASPVEHLERRQAQALVLQALEQIPLERRGIFVMHDIDGTPIPEVAERLEIPLNTAYSRLRLARRDFAGAITSLKEDSAA
ncbi:MAG: sigma-70 family RNA polymerase sigma factor [Archangium sp.]|nr:sigma-70 family RNA polymerase sigma factor [Archangium sp.]